MVKLNNYWYNQKHWWYWDEKGKVVIKDDAPAEVKNSYSDYLKEKERLRKYL